jgi:hypothetical protein
MYCLITSENYTGNIQPHENLKSRRRRRRRRGRDKRK